MRKHFRLNDNWVLLAAGVITFVIAGGRIHDQHQPMVQAEPFAEPMPEFDIQSRSLSSLGLAPPRPYVPSAAEEVDDATGLERPPGDLSPAPTQIDSQPKGAGLMGLSREVDITFASAASPVQLAMSFLRSVGEGGTVVAAAGNSENGFNSQGLVTDKSRPSSSVSEFKDLGGEMLASDLPKSSVGTPGNGQSNTKALPDSDAGQANVMPAGNTGSVVEQDQGSLAQVHAPPDLQLDAAGVLTPVDLERAGRAWAEDSAGRPLIIEPDTEDALTVVSMISGLHRIHWCATDRDGQRACDQQTVSIRPQVSFADASATVEEGARQCVVVALSGPPVAWPVQVPYEVSAQDSTVQAEDFQLLSASVLVWQEPDGGGKGMPALERCIDVEVIADNAGEPEERLILQLLGGSDSQSLVGAVIGELDSHALLITEQIAPPSVTLDRLASGELVAVVGNPDQSAGWTVSWYANDDLVVQQQDDFTWLPTPAPSECPDCVYRAQITDAGGASAEAIWPAG